MMTIRGVPTYLPPANDDAMMTLRGVPTYLPSRSPKIILRNIGMVPYLKRKFSNHSKFHLSVITKQGYLSLKNP